MKRYDVMLEWLAGIYVNTLDLIQYMHDKYYYEAAEMALIDTDVRRTFATGIAGFSHVIDSLSAIKYAKVKPIRNEQGLAVDFEIEGDFPATATMMTAQTRSVLRCSAPSSPRSEAPHLPQRRADHLYPYHYLQRGIRQGYRHHA